MTRPKVITIGECRVDIWHDHHILATVFSDGLSVPAAANDDPDSMERAASLGYSDTWTMSLHHELSHTLLAVARGKPYSPVLRGVAVRESGGNKEDVISQFDSNTEEGLVLEFQSYVMTGVCPPYLWWWAKDYNVDLDALAADLRSMTA